MSEGNPPQDDLPNDPAAVPTEGNGDGNDSRIERMDIREEMQQSYLTYAMSVIISRALPDVRDGAQAGPAANPGVDERPEPRAVLIAFQVCPHLRRYLRPVPPAR